MKNTLTQKKIDRLDKIAKKCKLELYMPPFKGQHCPFFVILGETVPNKNQRHNLLKELDDSNFAYGLVRDKNNIYLSIKR